MHDLAAAVAKIEGVNRNGPYQPNWDSIAQQWRVPAWYERAKFGIFIHWGVYSVPAFGNEWYPRNMYLRDKPEYAHHLKTYGPQDQFGYKDFIPRFTAEHFDPREWAQLFVDAGAKFVVPVAEHHDGFAMYDCSFSPWTAVKMGPRRNLIGDLLSALREKNLICGLSSHRAENYWFFNGGRDFPSDVQDEQLRSLYNAAIPIGDFHGPASDHPAPPPEHLADWLARTCELVDLHRPKILYFDWWIEHAAFAESLQQFAAYYYNRAVEWGEQVAIDYKLNAFPRGGGVLDIERGQLGDIRRPFWQTDTSVSKNSWGYVQHHDYKSATVLIHDLIDIVSKNGALLLNIGPRADGTIPKPEQNLLRTIGDWLRVNGEAIFDTHPWKRFGEGPTLVPGGGFTDKSRPQFTSQDIRFTARDGYIYATLLRWPENRRVNVVSCRRRSEWLSRPIQSVTLLGSDAPLQWSQEDDGLAVQLPHKAPCADAYVLKMQE